MPKMYVLAREKDGMASLLQAVARITVFSEMAMGLV